MMPRLRNRPAALFAVLRLAWAEARPVVQLIFMLRFTAGAALGWQHFEPSMWWSTAVAATGWAASTWAIYLLNGIADITEDRENGSRRPIASGRLATGPARATVWGLSAVALACGAVVSTTMLLLIVLMLVVGWAYSMGPYPAKMTVPTFVVSVIALGLLTYLAGWYAVANGERPSLPLLMFGAVMSAWMGLVGSTKDLSDVKGDRLAGRRTLPVILGDRRARLVMAALAGLVGLSFLTAATRLTGLLPAATVLCAGSTAVMITVLNPRRGNNRTAARRPYRAFMITQYLAHLTILSPITQLA